jgi:hypothetical protein
MDTPRLLDCPPALSWDRPFTRATARAAGLTDKTLHRLVKAGHLRRPVERVYVAAHVPDSIALRCEVLSLVVPPGCFVCDRTAAWLHAGARALGPNEHLAVPRVSCFRPSDAGRLRNELTASGERAVLPHDLILVDGILVTTPLRTALDLGRLQPTRDLKLHGMDTMLALGGFSHEELLAQVPRFTRRRGVVALRVLAPLADPRSESFGETALRLRWHDAGLPRPELQIPVWIDGQVAYRLDLGIEELLFAAEYDGEQWHSSPVDVAADAVRRDRLGALGWMVEVFRAADVHGVRQDADLRLRHAFRRARATLGARTYFC